jgi:hypothetical protein
LKYASQGPLLSPIQNEVVAHRQVDSFANTSKQKLTFESFLDIRKSDEKIVPSRNNSACHHITPENQVHDESHPKVTPRRGKRLQQKKRDAHALGRASEARSIDRAHFSVSTDFSPDQIYVGQHDRLQRGEFEGSDGCQVNAAVGQVKEIDPFVACQDNTPFGKEQCCLLTDMAAAHEVSSPVCSAITEDELDSTPKSRGASLSLIDGLPAGYCISHASVPQCGQLYSQDHAAHLPSPPSTLVYKNKKPVRITTSTPFLGEQHVIALTRSQCHHDWIMRQSSAPVLARRPSASAKKSAHSTDNDTIKRTRTTCFSCFILPRLNCKLKGNAEKRDHTISTTSWHRTRDTHAMNMDNHQGQAREANEETVTNRHALPPSPDGLPSGILCVP